MFKEKNKCSQFSYAFFYNWHDNNYLEKCVDTEYRLLVCNKDITILFSFINDREYTVKVEVTSSTVHITPIS